MRKIVLFFTALLAMGSTIAQTDCSDIFISEYVEGWNNNKALELYNPTSFPIVLDNVYRLIRFSNGSTTSDQDPLYNLPLTGTIAAFTTWVIIQDTTKPGQDTMVWPALRKKANWLAPYDYGGTTQGGNCVFWNGDDAISVQKKQTNGTWKDIDIFGEIGVRPKNWQGTYSPSGAWTDTKPYILGTGWYLTKSHALIRKPGIKHGVDRNTMIHYGDSITGGVPNSFYALLEYDTIPVNVFDSLGKHTCVCKSSSGIQPLVVEPTVIIQPNPVQDGQFTIVAEMPVSKVEMISAVGRTVYSRDFSSGQKEIKVLGGNLSAGVYLVRISFGERASVVKKIILQ